MFIWIKYSIICMFSVVVFLLFSVLNVMVRGCRQFMAQNRFLSSYTLHTIHYTLYTIQYTIYTILYTLGLAKLRHPCHPCHPSHPDSMVSQVRRSRDLFKWRILQLLQFVSLKMFLSRCCRQSVAQYESWATVCRQTMADSFSQHCQSYTILYHIHLYIFDTQYFIIYFRYL